MMQKEIEMRVGSGNVYADLGFANSEKLYIKAGLVFQIRQAMRKHGLNQQAGAQRMGISQAKISNMMRGDFSGLSERKLMDCLNKLGYDIEITVKEADQDVGHLMLAF